MIITLSIYFWCVHFPKRIFFQTKQADINEVASGIDIQLAKRRDTLVQAFDATSKFMKYEKSYILEDTKLRNINVNANSRNEVEEISNSAFSKLLAVNEQYPDIKSAKHV